MEHGLIPPTQLWEHGVTVDITPKSKSNGKSIHRIYAPQDDVYVPFSLHGFRLACDGQRHGRVQIRDP